MSRRRSVRAAGAVAVVGDDDAEAEEKLFGVPADRDVAGEQLARLLSGEVLGIVGRTVELDTLRLEQGARGRSDIFERSDAHRWRRRSGVSSDARQAARRQRRARLLAGPHGERVHVEHHVSAPVRHARSARFCSTTRAARRVPGTSAFGGARRERTERPPGPGLPTSPHRGNAWLSRRRTCGAG